MGCAFPLTATYILLGGSVFPTEWTIWSCAGVVFLGVGDTCAAVFGKKWGVNKWRESVSKKTKEGSSYLIFSTGFVYYLICAAIDRKQMMLFLCYVFAAMPAAVLEGCTLQYDNLSCSMFYFTAIVFFTTMFM